MHLIVDAATRRVIAAADDAVPPEPWPGPVLEITRPGAVADLWAEAGTLGSPLDLDDIQVDTAGAVIGVSRTRPLPPAVQARLDWAASLLAGKSMADIDALIDQQVTTIVGSRALLKALAKAVLILARERGLV